MTRLRRSDCSGTGLSRRRCGRGFVYLAADGRRVEDPVVLERIRELVIPPAWRDVWICSDERGHLQATGHDEAGRKQYLYHPDWRTRRDREKFTTMLEFAARLPRLRRRVERELRSGELDRRRMLACAVRLLDVGCFRVGSEDYARENGSHGLTTIHREHVRRRGAELVFDYPGKSGQRLVTVVDDPAAVAALDALLRRRRSRPEEQLLAYRDGRAWRPVRAEDINTHLKECLDGDFTAKDFRTWNATVLAAASLARAAPAAQTKTARRRAITAAVGVASECLGNTPAVCRASYIDPRLFDRFDSGWTLSDVGPGPTDRRLLAQPRRRARIEAGVLDLLTERATDEVIRLAA
ncbi:MAG: topoisomerase [Solirubrobacteraceae bacterium]|nr:topoisomerase [Solirubrobacteraceae bacterium]